MSCTRRTHYYLHFLLYSLQLYKTITCHYLLLPACWRWVVKKFAQGHTARTKLPHNINPRLILSTITLCFVLTMVRVIGLWWSILAPWINHFPFLVFTCEKREMMVRVLPQAPSDLIVGSFLAWSLWLGPALIMMPETDGGYYVSSLPFSFLH